MAHETFTQPAKLARPPQTDELAPAPKDASSEVRQRFLDEIIGRPPAGPSEKLQVIRDSGETEKTKPQVSGTNKFDQRARELLDQAHQSLSFTNDQFEPRVIPYQNRYRVPANATVTDIAKSRLGANASDAQVKAYADVLIRLNKLDATTPDTVIEADTTLKLPGQRSNGALFYRQNGTIVSEWQDGSLEKVTERGKGYAKLQQADGTEVEISWNSERAAEGKEIRIKGDKRTDLTPDGTKTDRVKDKDGKWQVSRIETKDPKDRGLVAEFTSGGKTADTVTITDKDKTVIQLKWDGKAAYTGQKLNAKGEVVEKNVSATPTRSGFSIYWENDAPDNGKRRTYEDGNEELYDSDDNLAERVGKDAWGRKVVEKYEGGDPLPYEIAVSVKENQTLTFTRQPFGWYTSPWKDEKGKELGSIDLMRNGLLVYNNEAQQTADAELPDGTKISRRHLSDGKQEITETKDGNVLKRNVDRQGTVIDAEYSSADGRNIYRKISSDGQSIEKVVITDQSKAKTELAYDRDVGLFTGARKSASGELLEKCYYFQGRLVYSDVKTGLARIEKLNFMEKDLFGLKVSSGTYDALTGTVTTTRPDGAQVVESFAPGRTDVIKDGTITGSTVIGERSSVSPTGETVVHQPDDSGFRLNADGSVDRWGQEDKQNAQEEPLTKTEGEFLRRHKDIDRRDLLAIHAQYHDEPAKLDSFYKALSTLDNAKNLSAEEKTALRKDIMHHVAFPAEIYQGNTWCCNVAVCERDMAMNTPDRYAKMLIDGLSEGKVALPDGTTLPVDQCNLRVVDSSGRNMASRVFQTIAIQAKYHPKYTFTNTEDGVGRLLPGTDNARPAAFVGLNMDEIAAVRHRLTGEKKAVVAITSVDDLFTAWEANQARSMTIAVNADEAPFSDNGFAALFAAQTESSPNHVVSITRLEEGPPPVAYVQNQWGLWNDHSTPDTAVPVETLLGSMIGRVRNRMGRIVPTPAQALTTGEPGKTYLIKDGQLIEEKRRR